jgi:hypothetical protein
MTMCFDREEGLWLRIAEQSVVALICS